MGEQVVVQSTIRRGNLTMGRPAPSLATRIRSRAKPPTAATCARPLPPNCGNAVRWYRKLATTLVRRLSTVSRNAPSGPNARPGSRQVIRHHGP